MLRYASIAASALAVLVPRAASPADHVRTEVVRWPRSSAPPSLTVLVVHPDAAGPTLEVQLRVTAPAAPRASSGCPLVHRDGWQFSAAFVDPEVTAASSEAGAGVGVRGGVRGGVVGGELKPQPVRSTCVAAPGLGVVAYDVVARLDMSDAWTLPPGEPGRRISNLSVTGGIHVRLPVALGARIVDCAWHIGVDAKGPDGEASLVWTSQPRLGESTSPVCSPRSVHVGR